MMTPDSPDVGERSPFLPPGRRSSRFRGAVVFLFVLGAAALAVWLLRPRTESGVASSHDHSAAMSDSGRTVVLSAEAAHRIGVTFAVAEMATLNREVRTVATVSYDETRLTAITARVDGWVEQLYLNYTGQAVRVGDPLFTLYSPMLVSAQQELLLASRLRRQVAAGTGDAVANAEDLLRSARQRLRYWEVPADEVRGIEEREEIRRTITFRSSVAGVVIEKLVVGGQRLMAGETLYRIADLRTVWLEGEIYERDLSAVRLGLAVSAEFPALPGTTRTGRITYVAPTLNPETRTVRVRVELANPDFVLKPGMYATLRFAGAAMPALSVPRSAVLVTGKRNIVFVRMPNGGLTPRDVTIGVATDDRIEILAGLSSGETVVASATFLVDAESNLGSLLGGMGGMPGMDMSPPASTSPERR